MPREFSRNQRLGAQMLRTLSELLRFESKVKVLFDKNVLDFLDIESLVFSAERTAEYLMELDH